MNDMDKAVSLRELREDSADIPSLESVNNEAFPDNERIPVDELFSFSKKSGTKILGIYHQDRFVGFFVTLQYKKCVYINYFAIDPNTRGMGYGSSALDALCNRYPDCQIVVDYESADESSENYEQRLRRRGFYIRNGFIPTGLYLYYMETEFESACRQGPFNEIEFRELYAVLERLADCFHPRFYKKS